MVCRKCRIILLENKRKPDKDLYMGLAKFNFAVSRIYQIANLNSYFVDLSQNGFIDFTGQISGWLNIVQSKSSIFVDYLKRLLYG